MGDAGVLGTLAANEDEIATAQCPAPPPTGPGVLRVEIETKTLGRVTVCVARMREPRWKRLKARAEARA